MSNQEHTLIVQLIQSKFQELNDKQDIQTKAILTEMNAGFTLSNTKADATNKRIDTLVEQKKEQNGRIGKLEFKTDETNKRTRIWQFIQTKPWYAITISVIFIAGLVYLSNNPSILFILKTLKIF